MMIVNIKTGYSIFVLKFFREQLAGVIIKIWYNLDNVVSLTFK